MVSNMHSPPDKLVPFAPAAKSHPSEAAVLADASGKEIMAMLRRLAELAKEDCRHAMDLAHKLAFQVRTAEDKAREAEVQLAYFRDRASRAEAWLARIQNEIQQTFFRDKQERLGEQKPEMASSGKETA
jgi:hypothetical protein